MTSAGILMTDERVELIDGYLVAKMPKGPEHVWSSQLARDLLEPLLGGGLCLSPGGPRADNGLE